jgi:hypothetical protein
MGHPQNGAKPLRLQASFLVPASQAFFFARRCCPVIEEKEPSPLFRRNGALV